MSGKYPGEDGYMENIPKGPPQCIQGHAMVHNAIQGMEDNPEMGIGFGKNIKQGQELIDKFCKPSPPPNPKK